MEPSRNNEDFDDSNDAIKSRIRSSSVSGFKSFKKRISKTINKGKDKSNQNPRAMVQESRRTSTNNFQGDQLPYNNPRESLQIPDKTSNVVEYAKIIARRLHDNLEQTDPKLAAENLKYLLDSLNNKIKSESNATTLLMTLSNQNIFDLLPLSLEYCLKIIKSNTVEPHSSDLNQINQSSFGTVRKNWKILNSKDASLTNDDQITVNPISKDEKIIYHTELMKRFVSFWHLLLKNGHIVEEYLINNGFNIAFLIVSLSLKASKHLQVILRILEKLCWNKTGHRHVENGFQYTKNHLNEPMPYFTLYVILKNSLIQYDESLAIRMISFLNAYVNNCKDIEKKLFIQYSFKNYKINSIIEKFKQSPNQEIKKLIAVYFDNQITIKFIQKILEENKIVTKKQLQFARDNDYQRNLKLHINKSQANKLAILEKENSKLKNVLKKLLKNKNKDSIQLPDSLFKDILKSLSSVNLDDIINDEPSAKILNNETNTHLKAVETLKLTASQPDHHLEPSKQKVDVPKSTQQKVDVSKSTQQKVDVSKSSQQKVDVSKSSSASVKSLPSVSPPPPPGIPPPPGLPSLKANIPPNLRCLSVIKHGIRMQLFNWYKLPLKNVIDSLFSKIELTNIINSFQNKLFNNIFELKPVKQVKKKIVVVENKFYVSPLSNQRMQNVLICMKPFGGNADRVLNIYKSLDYTSETPSIIQSMLNCVPNADEYNNVKRSIDEYLEKNPKMKFSDIPQTDRFFYIVGKHRDLEHVLRGLHVLTDINVDIETLSDSTNALYVSLKYILTSQFIKEFFSVILYIGNYINSEKRGLVYGFELDSLQKINEYQSKQFEGVTLMHYIAHHMRRHHKRLMDETKQMAFLQVCTGYEYSDLKNEMIRLRSVVLNLNEMIEKRKASFKNWTNDELESTISVSSQELVNIGDTLEMIENIFIKLLKLFSCNSGMKTSEFLVIWNEFFQCLNKCIFDINDTPLGEIFTSNSHPSKIIQNASDSKNQSPKTSPSKTNFSPQNTIKSNNQQSKVEDIDLESESNSDDLSEDTKITKENNEAPKASSIADKMFNKNLLDQIEEFSNEDDS